MVELNTPRTKRAFATSLAIGAALLVGCAHEKQAPTRAVALDLEEFAEEAPSVFRPQSQLEARALLQRAFQASAENRVEESVALISAVLATDFLTDRGRVNLYWLVAEGQLHAGETDAHFDALGMFLIASELIEGADDEELTTRKLLARSVLAARRVAVDPEFGRRIEMAIDVEDVREPNRIFAALPCGPAGSGRFVDVSTEAHEIGESRLVHRTARCDSDLAQLELWFDVTHASGATPINAQ